MEGTPENQAPKYLIRPSLEDFGYRVKNCC